MMTVEEFRCIPEPAGEFDLELHHGVLAKVARPKQKHYVARDRLVTVLTPLLSGFGVVSMELAFRALPEHELRAADVACVETARWHAIDPQDNLHGAPDLVIEILSPSNTAAEMYEREQLCLDHGARQFWTVDLVRRQVRVASLEGPSHTYQQGQRIPLAAFGTGHLAVDDIFKDGITQTATP